MYASHNTQLDASFITATTCRVLGIDGPANRLSIARRKLVYSCVVTTAKKIVNLSEAYKTETIPANRDRIQDPQSALKWPYFSELFQGTFPVRGQPMVRSPKNRPRMGHNRDNRT